MKRPDTALSRRQGRGRGGETQGTEKGDAGDGKEATAETSAEVEGERERRDVEEDERNGCWSVATHSVWPRGEQGWAAAHKTGRER